MTNEQLFLVIQSLLDQLNREVDIIEQNLPENCWEEGDDFFLQKTRYVPVLVNLKSILAQTRSRVEILRGGNNGQNKERIT